MRIRDVKRADVPQIARLYYETVRRVNARDYSPEQIQAWVPRIYPDAFWQRRFRRYRVFVAEEADTVIGFVELAANGDIDCLYVHHAHQHQGVGAALMARAERQARRQHNPRLRADVSTTAQPFFRRMGFSVVRRQVRIYRGRPFNLAVMEKRLPGAGRPPAEQ
jgi:putative acetyltransferase